MEPMNNNNQSTTGENGSTSSFTCTQSKLPEWLKSGVEHNVAAAKTDHVPKVARKRKQIF